MFDFFFLIKCEFYLPKTGTVLIQMLGGAMTLLEDPKKSGKKPNNNRRGGQ